MRNLFALAFLMTIAMSAVPASAQHVCNGSWCPLPHRFPGTASYVAGRAIRLDCCQSAPAGWGWYLRQKFRADRSAPLVVDDELSGTTLIRDR
jgi:hypothetical protein